MPPTASSRYISRRAGLPRTLWGVCAGCSSPLRDRLGEKRKVKVGHGGTLDPLATEVLVLGIGKGCRDLEAYLKGTKRYRTRAPGLRDDDLIARGTRGGGLAPQLVARRARNAFK